jgi:hypothetical protein
MGDTIQVLEEAIRAEAEVVTQEVMGARFCFNDVNYCTKYLKI